MRFHAMQSMLLTGVVTVGGLFAGLVIAVASLSYIGCATMMCWMVVWMGYIVLHIVVMIKAYQGKWFKVPIIGSIAMSLA